MNIHFVSGLPRAGSTLLTSILRQNPAFHSFGVSTALAPIVNRLLTAMGAASENYYLIDAAQRKEILKGVFHSYYKNIDPDIAILDTNRFWCSYQHLIYKLYPKSKIIVCVRDINAILDSFEKLITKNPLLKSRLFSQTQSITLQSRINTLLEANGVVGFAWDATQAAFFGNLNDQIVFVDYDALASEPRRSILEIYDFLEMPAFEHDFDSVYFDDVSQYDSWLGLPGLHTVSPRVELTPRTSILPPHIIRKNIGRSYWRIPEVNRRGVRVIIPSSLRAPPVAG